MSYSVNQQCWKCKKEDTCMDGVILRSAVAIIHGLTPKRGHLGGGSINHECSYGFEDRTVAEAPAT